MQPHDVKALITMASSQVGWSSSPSTYRVVDVEPFRGVGLHELAVNEQLGGGLEDYRNTLFTPSFPGYIMTESIKDIHTSQQQVQSLYKEWKDQTVCSFLNLAFYSTPQRNSGKFLSI